jgi:hypothetical protein
MCDTSVDMPRTVGVTDRIGLRSAVLGGRSPRRSVPRVPLWADAAADVVRRVVMMTDCVRADILVDAGRPGRTRRTMLHLEWRRWDPIAVQLRLSSLPDHPSLPRGQWSVLRDFLRYGLDEPTGDGDVRIVPRRGGRQVRLELTEDGRRTSFELPCATVLEFLERTERIEPSGEAGETAALDALVARLLALE